MNTYISEVLDVVARRNAGEPEFLQAAREVLESLGPVIERHRKYRDAHILERIVEPERQIIFRVAWQDDAGRMQVNRGLSFVGARLYSGAPAGCRLREEPDK